MVDQVKPSPWENVTFRYGPATITVERATVRHSMIVSRIMAELPDAQGGTEAWYQRLFARMIAQTVKAEGLVGYSLPSPSIDLKGLQGAYEQLLTVDGKLLDAWWGALEQVDRAPGPEDFWPVTRPGEGDPKN